MSRSPARRRRTSTITLAIVGALLIAMGGAGGLLLSRLLAEPERERPGRRDDRRFDQRPDRPDRPDRPSRGGPARTFTLPPEFTAPCTERVDPGQLENVTDPRALPASDRPLVPVTQRRVEFESTDGLRIPGMLMAPRGGGPHPGIVWVHGGLADRVDPQVVEAIARNGYAVLGVDYRGSGGYGPEISGQPDIGQKDVDDVIAAGRYLAGLPEVDPDRVAVAGGSRGAAMAFLAVIREPEVFDAVGAFYPIVDWACALQLAGGRVGGEFLEAFGGTPEEVPEAYIERSPYYAADQITVPVYMAHGLRDRRPPPTETVKMAEALEAEGRSPTVRYYNGLSHGFMEREPADSPLWEDFFAFLDRTL
ncbi:MAG TPA: prolyl oligopeptidase family serine peptidase [Actinomycetota bacterium]|nr:prolyl oligopeptidase family serine peptidase [Actinomycetota bacterium]